jgi:5'-nucleotidase
VPDRVLLVNDDGLDAPGLLALRRAFASSSEVWVVAPRDGKSASGHSITLPAISVHRVAERTYAIEGFPADCVKAALVGLLDREPDFIVSGINDGLNVGYNLHYSGTVAGALEGAMYGVPSFALSIDRGGDPSPVVRWAVERLPPLARGGLPRGVALNINFPASGAGEAVVVRQGRLRFVDAYEVRGERWTYDESGGVEKDPDPDTDSSAVARGLIAITPIRPSLTAHDDIETVRRLLVR